VPPIPSSWGRQFEPTSQQQPDPGSKHNILYNELLKELSCRENWGSERKPAIKWGGSGAGCYHKIFNRGRVRTLSIAITFVWSAYGTTLFCTAATNSSLGSFELLGLRNYNRQTSDILWGSVLRTLLLTLWSLLAVITSVLLLLTHLLPQPHHLLNLAPNL